jgi:HSP20 family molecular chaperone IbpA
MTVANASPIAAETKSALANNAAASAPSRAAVRAVLPRVDVYENPEELLLVADVPGATASSVNVRLEEAVLTLGAEYTRVDGSITRYQRAFQVPDTIDADQITAELKDGVLQVHLRKLERAKPRTIAVTAN